MVSGKRAWGGEGGLWERSQIWGIILHDFCDGSIRKYQFTFTWALEGAPWAVA